LEFPYFINEIFSNFAKTNKSNSKNSSQKILQKIIENISRSPFYFLPYHPQNIVLGNEKRETSKYLQIDILFEKYDSNFRHDIIFETETWNFLLEFSL
jgi:hypothetical protein